MSEQPNVTDAIEDAMCEALLMVYGLGYSFRMPLSEARDQVRAKARAVIAELFENGVGLVDLETPTP